ncbi:MAG TPA: phospholipid carrier-dependent glycosyltransferase, partial [Candidatus Binatia bacterium]|nr:phospholipid carrier-dependent glycosyltransferase [Candidatus Binatia bacterium]
MKNKEITFGTCVRWGELALVAAILIAVLGKGIQSVEFFGDESNWISTSYFIGPFLKGDIFSPVWQESYATKNQPPVPRYIIGVARRIGGFKAKDLNTRWKFDLNDRANFEGGAMPSPDLLWWSRLPMTVFAVVSGGLLFLMVRQAAGRLAGYAVLILFIGNPFLLTTLRRAMAESPLVVFILLAAYAGYRAMRSWRNVYCDSRSGTKRSFRALFWFSLMGIFVGLAAGAKLNGMSVLMAGLG